MEILALIWKIVSVGCVVFTAVIVTVTYYREKTVTEEGAREGLLQDALAQYKFVTVEHVSDNFLMYDLITTKFICNSSSEDELWKKAATLFNGKIVVELTEEGK